MLFRAFVNVPERVLRAVILEPIEPAPAELVVFFEAPERDPDRRLHEVIRINWRLPFEEIIYYNPTHEVDMRVMGDTRGAISVGPALDSALLQIGWEHAEPLYAHPRRTQMLVSPEWHYRLVRAQAFIERGGVGRLETLK